MDLWAFIDRSEWVLRKDVTAQQSQLTDDHYSTGSPFWRTSSANSQRDSNKQSPAPERKVIGASYSHADILKFNDLYVCAANSIHRS